MLYLNDNPDEIRRVMNTYNCNQAAFKNMNVSNNELMNLIFEQFIRQRLSNNIMNDWEIRNNVDIPT
jgi:hypothetical protein